MTTDTRERIVTAALELFAERGFHGTSVPDLAARAGVAAGTLYRHFEGKDALVNALYRDWKQVLLDRVFSGFPADAPFREQFHALWTRWTSFAADHPIAAAFLELHHHQDYLDGESRALEQGVEEQILAYVRTAQQAQVLADLPPPVLMALVHGAYVGLVRAARQGRITLDRATVRATEERLWAAVRR